MSDTPITREEKYLAYLTGDYKADVPKPITRQERYLYKLCLKGMGGEVSPEEIKNAVNEYLEKNPVKPGATTEQAQQIEQNKTDIDSLKEDISTKITKFYASSQGETHLADSDNGKIQDMMIYGRSEQKQYSGKNLLKPHAKNGTLHGVTCTYNNDGSISLKGTAENNNADFYYFGAFAGTEIIPNIDNAKTYTLSGTGTNKVQLFTSGLGNSVNGANITGIGTNISYVMYRVPNGTTVDVTIYPQLELGSEATSYEPYVGGIPSPNPDYPQEIKSVVNPTVKVCGKNLLNSTLQTMTQNGVTCTNNGDGTYTLNGTAKSQTTFNLFNINENIYGGKLITGCQPGGGRDTFNIVIVYYTKDRKWASEDYEVGNGKIIKIKNESSYLLSIGILVRTGYVCNNVIFKPMIAEGAASAYEPYREQIVTLPYDLYGIKVPSDGNVTINGQEYMSDYFDVERGKLVRMVDSSKLDNTQSIVDKTEWLLAEPQETDLTEEEVQALKALATYYPTTNISINSE